MEQENKLNLKRFDNDNPFIVYYLNYPKTVELCMTLQNVVHTQSNLERTTGIITAAIIIRP